ncbi:MAG TPA: endonuclease/exonuclease/phosphatase family protein [Polyangiaceae bacterium]|nr:endonuclease/exonuclease/phosphatase family protein [Polyangiaceae bacterium]
MVTSGMRCREGPFRRPLVLIASLVLSACEQGTASGLVLPHVFQPLVAVETTGDVLVQRPKVFRRTRLHTAASVKPEAVGAFGSSEDCLRLLGRGERAPRTPGAARIGSWNIHWFPDGVPGSPSATAAGTDLEWMACAIAWMNVDALALAEVKSKPYAEAALEQLTSRLGELTGNKYTVRVDDCPDQNGLHLAWLVSDTVQAVDYQIHASLNPHGDACAGQLRPGLGVRLRFRGGLDLHAVAIHFKSGTTARDIALRQTSFDALERVIANVGNRSGDPDVLIAGDFNTMGCRECQDVTRSGAESSWLDTRLKAFRPEARRVPNDLGCSTYYQRQPSLLDHFIVSSSMREAAILEKATVFGYCRDLGCGAYSGKAPQAATRLSDHCPLVLELRDVDLD